MSEHVRLDQALRADKDLKLVAYMMGGLQFYALHHDLDVPAALHIAEDSGGQAARVLGSLLGLW